MAFPEDPLGLRVEIKAGQWTDITRDVYTRDAITHTRGIRSSSTTAEPASVPLTINNRDGKYSPRNPMSPHYGRIGRNTPVRLSLPDGDRFLDLDGSATSYASTPDAAVLDITGDLDLRVELAASWHRPGIYHLLGKYGPPGSRSWVLRLVNGSLDFLFSLDGTNTYFVRRPLPVLPERAALRVTLDADAGDGQYGVAHYWAPSMDGPWTQLYSTYRSSAPPAPVALYSGPAPLAIGPVDLSATTPRHPVEGKVYGVEVRAGIDGTIVAAPDFTARPTGTASFADSAGRTWSFSGAAAVADRRDLFFGEIASWPQKWVASGADVWTPVQAAGILRRYGQGVKALDSTLRRRIPSGRPIAYWPMEEDRGASRAYSPISGVAAAAMTNVEFAALDTLPSSSALPKIGKGGTLSAIVPAHADLGQWQVEFVYNADDKAPSNLSELVSVSTTGTVRRWSFQLRNGAAWVYGYNSSGTAVIDEGIGVSSDVFHGWVRLRLWAREEGGVITWGVFFQDPGGDAGGRSRTLPGAAGRVTAVTANWPEALDGWGFGHLSVLPQAESALYTGSDSGYAGETAWARIQRLASEEAIPVSRIAGPLAPQRVGPQRPETLLSLFQEAADADGGMLVESRDRLGLLYRDRSSLYTQEPALVLDYAAGQIAAGSLEPTDDDDATRNDIIVSRTGGSSARAVLAEGPLSVQAPPDGIGLYDESVTLNVDDDVQLEYMAPWRLHLGTYDGARYPSVTIRLHKHPELIDTVLGLREGDILRLLNLPPWVAYGPVDLLFTGLSETYMPRTWVATLTCDPGGPWMTAKADHPTYGKADTDGSQLAGAVAETDTTLAVRTTAGPPWTSSPRETPFDVRFGGEVALVESVGQLINGNAWFDQGITGWTAAAGSVDWSQAVVHPKGKGSILVTPGGTAESHSADSPLSPAGSVVPGASYTLCGWFYSPTGAPDIRPSVYWYTDAGTYLTAQGGAMPAVPAGQWTYLESEVTAPATAGRLKVRARQGGTPPASQVFYAWGVRAIRTDSSLVSDTFSRSVTGGWGVAESGQVWTRSGGSASDYDVNGTAGRHVHATRDLFRVTSLNAVQLADVDLTTTLTVPISPTGDGLWTYFLIRTNAAVTSYYFARVYFGVVGQAELQLRKRTPTESLLASAPVFMTHTAGQSYRVRVRAEGPQLSAKAWKVQDPEPSTWQATATDTSIPGPGGIGVRSYISPSTANPLPIAVSFDDFRVIDVQTFTVTRSANGVVKPHTAGTPLALAHPAITSL
ncbi:carbohydrate binding domain-containing protein [Streptomyces sp. NPDC002795]|uniref:carbohydrate binding domain-containing protein n=1 Tax=Streptomyces sp. NPDC002795 TaxID=3364665 RepID=UPI0036C38CD6